MWYIVLDIYLEGAGNLVTLDDAGIPSISYRHGTQVAGVLAKPLLHRMPPEVVNSLTNVTSLSRGIKKR